MFKPNDKVTGVISGKYLGVVEFVSKDGKDIWVRGPDRCLIAMAPIMLSRVPEMVDKHTGRVWVGS